ncbi:MAG: CHAT domain-containing protein, partial [Raineya sp.]|nr:CHAT domain-containing protein [Raineya sp.]
MERLKTLFVFLVSLSVFNVFAQQKSFLREALERELAWYEKFREGTNYFYQEKYNMAEIIFLDLYEQTLPKGFSLDLNLWQKREYLLTVEMLVKTYLLSGKLNTAEEFCIKNIELAQKKKKLAGFLAELHVLWASVYIAQGKNREGENIINNQIKSRKLLIGKNKKDNDEECMNLLFGLTNLYLQEYRYKEVDSLLIKEISPLLSKIKVAPKKEQEIQYYYYLKLHDYYYQIGNISQAEILLNKAEQFAAENNQKYYLEILKGTCYLQQGRYKEAEELFNRVSALTKDKFENLYFLCQSNLGVSYIAQKRYLDAINLLKFLYGLYKEKMDIKQKYSIWLNIGYCYFSLKDYLEAEKIYKMVKNELGYMPIEYSIVCTNLGEAQREQRKYQEAKANFEEGLRVRKKVFGDLPHSHYIYSYSGLSLLHSELQNIDSSFYYYKEAIKVIYQNLQKNTAGLSEKEKEAYLEVFKLKLEELNFLLLKYQKPEHIVQLLENNLIFKGLLFYSTEQLRRNIEKSNNFQLKQTYQLWLEKRKELAEAYEMEMSKRKLKNINIEKLEKEVNDLEKNLSFGLVQANINVELSPRYRSWEEIKQKMQKDEAFVDISRLRYTAQNDSICYVAIVVKKDSKFPEMVILPNGKAMEQGEIDFYRKGIRSEDNLSYKTFFEPIHKKLKGIKKIYFSPDGVYHQLNLGTLYNHATKKYIFEEVDIQIVSTPRDFLNLGKNKSTLTNQTIYLFGYPEFEKEPNTPKKEETLVDYALINQMNKKQRFFDGIKITSLPGTKKEVENIYQIAQKMGIACKMYQERDASEDNLKNISSPYILHIATHGFFDESDSDNRDLENLQKKHYRTPLLRSGLLLAGAELSMNKKSTG